MPDDLLDWLACLFAWQLGKKRLKVQLKRLQDDALDGVWDDNGAGNEGDCTQPPGYSSRNSSANNTSSSPRDTG